MNSFTHACQFCGRHVPKYLLPRGMQVPKLNRKRKKKKPRVHGRREDNDPLRSFDGAAGDFKVVFLGSPEGGNGLDEVFDCDVEGQQHGSNAKMQKTGSAEAESSIFLSASEAGKSTAGRNQWKERHKKGKFSNKNRKSERKYKQPLGI